MDTTSATVKFDSRAILLPYALTLIVAMALIQALVSLSGGQITLVVMIATAVVALGLLIWSLLNRRALAHIRFGGVVAHAIAFAVVTTSFNLHALVHAIWVGRAEGALAVAQELLGTPWFGLTLGMSGLWGLGLTLHLIGAVLGRGWDD